MLCNAVDIPVDDDRAYRFAAVGALKAVGVAEYFIVKFCNDVIKVFWFFLFQFFEKPLVLFAFSVCVLF